MVTTGSMPHVGVIVLNYENAPDTINCMESLRSLQYPHVSRILVDNGSSEQCVSRLRERYGTDPAVQFIETGRNVGYAAGNNVGIRAALEAGSDYALVLNSDTIVESGFLKPLLTAMEKDPTTAIAMPRFLDANGMDSTPLRKRPSYRSYYGRFGLVGAVRRRRGGGGHAVRLTVTKPIEVEVPFGACMLIRTSFLRDIGLLDEGTFLYQEEVILAEQMRARGLRAIVVPTSAVMHLVGRSTSRMRLRRMWELWRSQNYYLRTYRGVSLVARASLIGYQLLSAAILFGLSRLARVACAIGVFKLRFNRHL